MVRFSNERRVEWKVSHFIKMPKERYRWWFPFFDTTIFGLYLSKKIWFHWLRWTVLSNVCEFELRWFQIITTIQRCTIPTPTAGILTIGEGTGEFIVAGSSSLEGSWGWRIHGGNSKFNWETIDCYDKLVKLAAVYQCRSNKCLNCKCAKNSIKYLRFCNCSWKCDNIWFWLHSIWNFRG